MKANQSKDSVEQCLDDMQTSIDAVINDSKFWFNLAFSTHNDNEARQEFDDTYKAVLEMLQYKAVRKIEVLTRAYKDNPIFLDQSRLGKYVDYVRYKDLFGIR